MAQRLIKDKDLSHIKPVQYGIKSEQHVIDLYVNKTGNKVFKCGLVVHKMYPFIGASPDGLVNSDGVLEIKCPWRARNKSIQNAKLEYLDHQGKLRINHNYYFQVQGLMEITNRPWCDFVIFSKVESESQITIQRINRNTSFWKNMLQQLQSFYLFYYLPTLICPGVSLTESNRRWTVIKNINFLPNGLVKDPYFYKKTPNHRDYTVAVYEDLNLRIKEIQQSDFESLNSPNYLTGFLVSVVLNIFAINTSFYVVEEIICSHLFNHTVYSDYFLENIHLTGEKLVLPTIIGNHFFLGIVDFENATFCFIDPFGTNTFKSKIYLSKFQNFISQYNKFHKTNYMAQSLKATALKHMIQTDRYNCGPIVLYIFEQIVKNNSPELYHNMEKYRTYIKNILLSNASPMENKCLFCTRNCTTLDSIQCNFCKRFVHCNCINVGEKQFIVNGICEICQIY